MLRRVRAGVCCIVGLCLAEVGANEITVWEQTGGPVQVQQIPMTVEIQGPGTFKIQATGAFNGLGDMAAITVASYVTGEVNIYILRRPEEGGGNGAHDVYALNLSGQATTDIVEARVAHYLGAGGGTYATSISGPFVAGAVLSPIDVAVLDGEIECNGLDAVSVTGFGTSYGYITVHGSYDNTIEFAGSGGHIVIEGDLESNGLIETDGDLAYLEVAGVLAGTVTVGADLHGATFGDLSGTVHVTNDLYSLSISNDVATDGVIDIVRDLAASGDAPSGIQSGQNLYGTVHVGRDALNQIVVGQSVGSVGHIDIVGAMRNAVHGSDLRVNDYLYGRIDVGTDLYADVFIAGFDYSGVLEVGQKFNGSLFNVEGLRGQVIIHGDCGCTIDIDQPYEAANLIGSVTILGAMTALSHLRVDGELSGAFTVYGSMAEGASIDIRHVTSEGQIGVGTLEGTLLVRGGDLAGSFSAGSIASTGSIDVADDLSGAITCAGNMAGTIECEALSGSIRIESEGDDSWDLSGTLTVETLSGEVFVKNDLSGTITVLETLAEGGLIEIGSTLSNEVVVATVDGTIRLATVDAGGSIRIAGVSDTGLVEVDGDVGGSIVCQQDMAGRIQLRNLTGEVRIDSQADEGSALLGVVALTGTATGSIFVEGALTDPNPSENPLAGGHIIVEGGLGAEATIETGPFTGTTEYIAINYDGESPLEPLDAWVSGGLVIVDETEYTWQEPEARVWAVSWCRADMNNDWSMDFDDIDPFIEALVYPDDYGIDYAGLDASRVYHGDCNVDTVFDFDDVSPFMALLGTECSQGGGDSLDPVYNAAEMARGMRTHVPAAHFERLLSFVAAIVDAQTDDSRQAYWQAVYDDLTQ